MAASSASAAAPPAAPASRAPRNSGRSGLFPERMRRTARHLATRRRHRGGAGRCRARSGAGQAAAPGRRRLTSAKVVECTRGPTADQRQATFRAGMVKVARHVADVGALHARGERGRRRATGPCTAPGLGVWRTSRTGVRAFAYRQRVKALAEGSAYRVKVQYRWHGRDGSVLKTAQRRSEGLPPDRPAAQPARPANRWTRRRCRPGQGPVRHQREQPRRGPGTCHQGAALGGWGGGGSRRGAAAGPRAGHARVRDRPQVRHRRGRPGRHRPGRARVGRDRQRARRRPVPHGQ